jgi:cytochrome oxidase Cu insertion factor (SCO1/SenC/PrrC family)
MSKARVWVLLALVLVIGLAIGFGVAALVKPGDATQIRNAELQVGDEAPDFRLPDHTGGYVRLSDFRGEQNVVVAFYPLAWTPV